MARCEASRWDRQVRHAIPCHRPATVPTEAPRWCGIHNPERVARRQQEREARWAEENERQRLAIMESQRLRDLARWAEGTALPALRTIAALADTHTGQPAHVAWHILTVDIAAICRTALEDAR